MVTTTPTERKKISGEWYSLIASFPATQRGKSDAYAVARGYSSPKSKLSRSYKSAVVSILYPYHRVQAYGVYIRDIGRRK